MQKQRAAPATAATLPAPLPSLPLTGPSAHASASRNRIGTDNALVQQLVSEGIPLELAQAKAALQLATSGGHRQKRKKKHKSHNKEKKEHRTG